MITKMLPFIACLVACTTTPPKPPPNELDPDPDASPPPIDDAAVVDSEDDAAAGPWGRACANLVRLGCPEGCGGKRCADGGGNTCATTLARADAAHLTILNPKCVTEAKTADALRKCSTAWATSCKGAP